MADGTAADVVRQPLGLRFFEIDPDKGFFLNGRHLQLKGVCRHQDRAEVGNALRREHHDEDAAFIADIGANAVRAAHYPQAERFYDLMRFAKRHNNNAWLADPISKRNGESNQDQGLRNLLMTEDNWYLNWKDQIGR